MGEWSLKLGNTIPPPTPPESSKDYSSPRESVWQTNTVSYMWVNKRMLYVCQYVIDWRINVVFT